MTRFRQRKGIPSYAVVGIVAVLALSAGWATVAYSQDNQQQYQNQQSQNQYQDQDQSSQSYQQQRSSQDQSQIRNMRLEQQIASRLRQQGYGTQGEIMILATGNRVILLGTVPDQRTKSGAENIAKQASSGARVDNRLHVNAQARRLPDAELEKNTYDKLGDNLSQSVQVRAQNGTVTLQGQLDNWRQVADAIDAAFASGATQVNSQFNVAGAGAMAQGGAGTGNYPSPGQQGQPSYGPSGQQGFQGPQTSMGGPSQASSSDLRLARQVASQLRQQLPPGQNIQLVQPQSIYVTAQRGTVILHGYVQNNNQKQQAQQIVQSIQGVQNVRNDLTILSTRGGAGQGGSQGYGGTNSQSSSYQPQGYISPAQGNQSQQGMSRQDQSSQSSGQQSFGGTTDQSQYGQSSQMGSSSQMSGRQAAMSASDIALAQKVAQQLKQQLSGVQNIQAMRPGTIYVMAAQGNVMLHGFITDQNVKQQASQIASAIPGVRNVANTLRVIGGAGGYPSYGYIPGQDQQSQQGTAGQGMAGQNQGMPSQNQGMAGRNQGTQGSAQMRFIAEPGQMGTSQSSQADMALAQQVAQKLRQQLSGIQNVQVIRPGTVYVMVNQGTVTLDGFVPDSNSKRQAEQIAKSVSGIQSVKNSLNISAGTGGQALGYIPADQDQSMNQQYGNQQFGNQQFGNQQSGNQALGYMPADEDQSANQQYGNQSTGNQSMGNQQYGNQQFGNQAGNQQFSDQGADEDQSASDQPDDGTN